MFQLLGESFVWPVWLPLVGRDHARLLLDNTGRSSCLSTTRASSLPSVWKFYSGGDSSKKYFHLFCFIEMDLKSGLPLHGQMVRIARSEDKYDYLFWPAPFNINIWFRHQSGGFSCQVSHYTIWTHGVLILSELILHKIHRLALPQFLIYLFFYCIKDSFKNILKNRNGVIYSRIWKETCNKTRFIVSNDCFVSRLPVISKLLKW